MTLWDILAAITKDRWTNRSIHRWTRMTAWPYWSKQPRFTIIQRYLMRRAAWILLLLLVFKINPFHPLFFAATILGLTLVRREHKTHDEQHRLLYNIKR